MDDDLICPVCGYPDLSQPPYDDHGDPSYEICACCGFEFGYDDAVRDYSFERYRDEWIANGFEYRRKPAPKSWSERRMRQQLENVERTDWHPILL